jgi:serine/threonine protein kinase HipA of HipAB toxin-antitoxin module
MRTTDFDATYYEPSEDKYAIQQLDDTRRPRLTLKHLNRLKKMRAARDLENLVRRDILNMLYGKESGEGGGLGGI